MPTIGERIRELRKANNLSQEEFGKLFGVVKSTISLYESGKNAPDDQIKVRICTHFNVSMDWLFGLNDSMRRTGGEDNALGVVAGLPDRLNDLMEEAHLADSDLQGKLGIPDESVSSLLKGHIPDLGCLNALANCFDVTTDYLLGRSQMRRITPDEKDLLNSYKNCDEDSRKYITSKALVLSVEGISGTRTRRTK